jgi:hypothetical protein
MKAFLNTVAVTGLLAAGIAPAIAATPASPASGTCQPGMTASGPGACSLPGFHWASTVIYGHHHAQSEWMLLPNK